MHDSVPQVVLFTQQYEPWNDFMLLEANGKFGALDVSTLNYVLPEYDQIDADFDGNGRITITDAVSIVIMLPQE